MSADSDLHLLREQAAELRAEVRRHRGIKLSRTDVLVLADTLDALADELFNLRLQLRAIAQQGDGR